MLKAIGVFVALVWASSINAQSSAEKMQIEFHTFWRTQGERDALQSLVESIEPLNIDVNVVESPSYNDLRYEISKRIGLGYPPEITHWLGGEDLETVVRDGLTFLDPGFADKKQLRDKIHPEVLSKITVGEHIYAIPVGIHLQSSIIYNMARLKQVGVTTIPKTWDELADLNSKLQASGEMAYAGTSEPWVLLELFNGILASIGQRAAIHALHGEFDPDGKLLEQLEAAMFQFLELVRISDSESNGRNWADMVKMVIDGEAAYTIIGDYAWSEINTHSVGDLSTYKCAGLPGLHSAYFGTDIFVAFETSLPGWREQYGNLLDAILEEEAQYRYLQKKGGISVVKNLDPAGLNPCSKASLERWNLDPNERFSSPGTRGKNSTALISSILVQTWENPSISAKVAAELMYNTVERGQ
ncbi:ABC transporter substrate-binding protein [Planktotalea sp.]|uniref:ABC transporter substrate-binding protein n=1 Tax=Planktotalea sp. TaxID=2029877 RepID=UPI003D6BC108